VKSLKKPKKVLLLGSGALQIGQAGEFDYSGSQAIKALKEEGIEVVVINPNIATVQTSKGFADRIYFLPVTPFFVEKVIEREKPDGIILSFGGQTALNAGLELEKNGVLKKHNVAVLGTQVDAIEKTEDRALFNKELTSIGLKVPKSIPCISQREALKAARKIGFPLIVRAGFSLGGAGSGVVKNIEELKALTGRVFSLSPQILVEEYLEGWKEIEYEVVRDGFDNCITVCNMENFDPMGIHTGESIVVAPSQTLSNREYHKLREISIKVIRHLRIVGECNIQFALNPASEDYRIIEVNARLSRSSALASKATGYPLAFVAAKLGLGYSLLDLENSITKVTKSCFEPALDYIVVKIPRWDLKKFRNVSKKIGSEMKSVGEVMAIGRCFEEAMQKAVRMLQIGMYGLVGNKIYFQKLSQELKYPTDERVFAVMNSLIRGDSVEKIHGLTHIDKWFLFKLQNVVRTSNELKGKKLDRITKEQLLNAKKLGFSDKQIAMLVGEKSELTVREYRKGFGIRPFVKQIDTLAAEYPAKTNYLYLTYDGLNDDAEFTGVKQVMVLGSGAYRIGSSVEFDWCSVSCVKQLKRLGYSTIMVNYNPETVSTDYDICDKLYFDELSLETVLDIYEKEKPVGVIISTGGQIPNNLAIKLSEQKVKILGTSAKSIDSAEDRHKFSRLCDELGIDQPEWKELTSSSEALKFAKKAGFPVLVRPSYVLSGQAMNVAFTAEQLKNYLSEATLLSKDYPVVISKFILNARETEIDAVADNGKLLCWAMTEHIENAGVHSGDATMVLPPQRTYLETMRQMKQIAEKIAVALSIRGPFNIQFIAKDNNVRVIECNLRASRSFPFVSKVIGTDFIEIATNAIMGEKTSAVNSSSLELDRVGVKAPQFSFTRLRGADPISGVEMASTGEVACIGRDLEDAFLKALLSTGFKLPEKNILISLSGDENRYKVLEEVKGLFKAGYKLYGTEHTALFYQSNGIKVELVHKMHENKKPNVSDLLGQKKLDLVISVPNPLKQIDLDKNYDLRRLAVDHSVPLITNLQLAKLFIESILKRNLSELEIEPWEHYV